jgi:hypothetical protein
MGCRITRARVVWLPGRRFEPGPVSARHRSRPGPAHTAIFRVARDPGCARSPHSPLLASARAAETGGRMNPRVLGFAELSRLLSPSSSPSRSPSPPREQGSTRSCPRELALGFLSWSSRSRRLAWSSHSRLASPGAPVAAAVEVRLCLLLSPSSSPSPVSSPRSSPRSKHWAGRSSAAPPCGHGSRLLCLSRTDLTLRR